MRKGRSSHRTYRRLAATLAAHGLLALRFDYDATGDSAGAMADPGPRRRPGCAAPSAAHAFLTSLGVPEVAAVGMRLGATIAAWSPPRSPTPGPPGATWCSGTRAPAGASSCARARRCTPSARTPAQSALVDDGLRHTPGFQYDQETARALRGLDLTALPDVRLARRALLLTRDDRPVVSAVEDRVRLRADDVTTATAHDQHLLLDVRPSDGQVPQRTVEEIARWLAHGAPTEAVAVVVPSGPDGGAVLEAVPPDGGPAARVRERAVTLGAVGLAGVVVEPVDGPAAGRPWIVLPNVAAEHHIGPGRRWVEFARSWAAQGHRCLRVDYSGVGDSPTRPGQHEDQSHAPEWVADLDELMADLRADGSGVVFVALCSGAYSAFEAALLDEVDAIFAINPRLTLWDYPADLRHVRVHRAAFIPARPFQVLREHRPVLASGLWRIWRQVAIGRAPYAVLRQVLRRGTEVEMVLCHEDGKHFVEVAAWWPRLWWDRRRGRLRLEQDDVYDHSLLTRTAQERAFVRATAFLDRVVGR